MQAMNRRNKVRVNKPITVGIACSGTIHTITLKPSGALVLNDHSKAEQEAERTLVALGAQTCKCLQLLDLWRDPREWVFTWQFPEELRSVVWTNLSIRWKRRREQVEVFRSDLLRIPLEERIPKLTRNWALRLLQKAEYRRSGTRHDTEIRVSRGEACGIVGNGDASGTKWVARIGHEWHRLYRLGAALVGGVFVVDLLEELPDGRLRVLAGRQGDGCWVYSQQALLTRNPGGWNLQWIKRSAEKR